MGTSPITGAATQTLASPTQSGLVSPLAQTFAGDKTFSGALAVQGRGTGDGFLPPGVVVPFAGATTPSGWLLCAGQLVSRTTFAALFAIVSTTYGAGDGSTTFALPDLRGRVVAGKDDMGGSAANRLTSGGSGITGTTLGAAGGTQTHVLSTAELASHSHGASGLSVSGTNSASSISGTANFGPNLTHDHVVSDPGHTHSIPARINQTGFGGTALANGTGTGTVVNSNLTNNSGTGITIGNSGTLDHSHTLSGTAAAQAWSGAVSGSTSNAGSGTAHQNTQPTIVLNYIIKT